MLQDQSTSSLLRIIGNNEIVFIDEVQRVENIGLTLKQIYDSKPECQLVVTGSSAFEFKWNPTKKSKISKSFIRAYPNSKTQGVNRDNFTEFVA